VLLQYEAPPLDPAVDEALLDFIAHKKAGLPDAVR
jgi:trimethylamine---corrinoid protein Co-methyltransferase